MAKTRLNSDEIAQAVLTEIRSFDACRNVQDVVIGRTDQNDANWQIDSFIADGAAAVSHDCKIHAFAVQRRLQRDFDVIWPNRGDLRPGD
jgi:hypothetical protein